MPQVDAASINMDPETLNVLIDRGIAIGGSMMLALLILIVGWLASKWANRLVLSAGRVRHIDEALLRFAAGIAQYAVLALTVIAALARVGVETTSMVALVGSAGLALGLALQGTLGHFASGVLILFFRPFTLGDVVTVSGQTGVVKDIGLFATTLVTPENITHIVPNGAVVGGVITNITTAGTRRGTVGFGVAHGADTERVLAVAHAAIAGCPLVLAEPGAGVSFVRINGSSLDFEAYVWGKAPDYLAMLHQVRSAIHAKLNEEGIEIPFPQMVLHKAE